MVDNAPNFDAMTPEEIMAWMESLAKRQGANEGFTTSADMDVPEIDPTTVVIDEPGYIPPEGSKAAKEMAQPKPAAPPAAKPVAASAPPARSVTPPAPPPRPAAPPPVAKAAPVTPAAPPPAASATPDFDKMSPEELMRWMESLAKRQGASDEQMMTAGDMDIPEIDPATAVIDGPGYVPPEGSKAAKEMAQPKPAAPPAKPVTTAPAPVTKAPEPVISKPVAPPPAPPVQQPAAELTLMDFLKDTAPSKPAEAEPVGLSFLESLVADQGDLSFDLSGLGADLGGAKPVEAAPAAGANPLDWLDSLTRADAPEQPAAIAADDPINWLESLAKRQGASDDELMTSADQSLPSLDGLFDEGPGYTPYTFETPGMMLKSPDAVIPVTPFSDDAAPPDPAAWLDELASSASNKVQLPPPSKPVEDIQSRLARGEKIPHEEMEAWMHNQLLQGAEREEPDELVGDYDPDAPPVKAELPDWLREQVGDVPANLEEPPPTPAPVIPLDFKIIEPPEPANMPDWLKEEEPDSADLDNIFAAVPTQDNWAQPAAPAPVMARADSTAIDIDPTDPWVEALEREYAEKHGQQQPTFEAAPVSAAPPAAPAVVSALQDAALPPETELPLGQPDSIPAWLSGVLGEPVVEATPAAPAFLLDELAGDAGMDELPDWLSMDVGGVAEPSPVVVEEPLSADWLSGLDVSDEEIPDWLKATIAPPEPEVVVAAPAPVVPAAPPPAPVIAPPAAAPIVPAAVRTYIPAAPPANFSVPAALSEARSFAQGNDVENSLGRYEMIIRANAELDTVVSDLSQLVEKHKSNPSVYRVLGDGLMRQGKLQAALDTYRKALNQL